MDETYVDSVGKRRKKAANGLVLMDKVYAMATLTSGLANKCKETRAVMA